MEYFQNDMLNYFATRSGSPVYKIAFQYATDNQENKAALNFHLTKREEKDIMSSINSATNKKSFERTLELFKQVKVADTVKAE